MRIGLITNMMDGQNAGIGRYTENMVKNLLLIDKKNEYYIIYSNKKHYNFNGNYQEIRLPFFDSIPKKLITGTFLFEKICRDYKLDILHDLGQISPFFFKSKTKRVLTLFDLSPILFPQFFTRLTNIYTNLFPMVLKNTDRIITISENSKKDINKIFKIPKERITTTYLGVENRFKIIRDKMYLETIRRKYNLPKNFILFVGTIEPRKNLVTLIKAYRRIANKIELRLVIVGQTGWKYDNVFEFVQKNKLNKYVVFPGFVDDNDLPALYNLAKVFVYPSLYEGFGFPVLEAMACGCPVITSSNSSLSEITRNAAVLLNPIDSRGMSKAILEIVSNRKLRLKLINAGLKQAKEFDWKNCAERTLNVYRSLIYA